MNPRLRTKPARIAKNGPGQPSKAGSTTVPHTAAADTVVINARGVARLRAAHPWVYRSDIVAANAGPAALVAVLGEAGKFYGSALYSSASQIAIRMLSDQRLTRDEFRALLGERIAAAVGYRRALVEDTDAYRVIFSEADFLPGLIVDRYNDVLSLQALTQAADDAAVRDVVVAELTRHFQPAGIVERVDNRIRDLEQLPSQTPGLLYGQKSKTVFTMNGIRFHYDGLGGQKTGAFLDQRENYAAASHYAHGNALDVFCYQGGFALHLAGRCERVTGVEISRSALEVAEQNAALNGRELEWIEANAFDLLKDYASAGHQYNTIVLDPPAFAKTQRNVETALRGYKELNLRALKMLRPRGILITCSCSYHVTETEFVQVLASAALDAHRQARVLENRTQAKDHPVLLSVPETHYLKCVILSVT